MKKAALLLLIFLQAGHGIAQISYSEETLKKIKEVENNVTGNVVLNDDRPSNIIERMAKYHAKGVSIAVIEHYKIVWAKGYGWADEAEKRKVTPQTLFEPGSISKSLNAVGILKLAQDKKIDLYTDINTYLTSWKFPYDSVSHGKKITLAQILSHTAGLSVYGFPGQSARGAVPGLLQVLDGTPPAVNPPVRSISEPGLKFEYSGGGIALSQLLLTDVTKEDYNVWMYEHVLKPLGMVNSFYGTPAKDKRHLCASGYYKDGTAVLNKYRIYPAQAAAGLWTTPSDLCKYIIDVQLAYKGSTAKVLTEEMAKLHITPYNNYMTAMGTFNDNRNGTRYFQHDATNDGFCGVFYGSLDGGQGVAILSNSPDAMLVYDILNSVARAYKWKDFYREPKRKITGKVINIDDTVLKTFEGIYLYDKTWAAVGEDHKKYYYYTGGIYADMYFTTPASFFNEEFAAVKEFVKDGQGRITGYTRNVDGKEYPAAVKVTDPDTLTLEPDVFSDIGWYFLEHKNYKEGLAYYKRGVQLYPNDLSLQLNAAHMYLLNKDYNSAIAIYKAHLKDTLGTGNTWEYQMQLDLMYFADHYYDVMMFDKVFAALNISKPKGY